MAVAENEQHQQRNYLRRKRCLQFATEEIAHTLTQIQMLRNEPATDLSIRELATSYAKHVEAACVSSRRKLSNEDYKMAIERKVRDLCACLSMRYAPRRGLNWLVTDTDIHPTHSMPCLPPVALTTVPVAPQSTWSPPAPHPVKRIARHSCDPGLSRTAPVMRTGSPPHHPMIVRAESRDDFFALDDQDNLTMKHDEEQDLPDGVFSFI
jgi:hypothetical protein